MGELFNTFPCSLKVNLRNHRKWWGILVFRCSESVFVLWRAQRAEKFFDIYSRKAIFWLPLQDSTWEINSSYALRLFKMLSRLTEWSLKVCPLKRAWKVRKNPVFRIEIGLTVFLGEVSEVVDADGPWERINLACRQPLYTVTISMSREEAQFPCARSLFWFPMFYFASVLNVASLVMSHLRFFFFFAAGAAT